MEEYYGAIAKPFKWNYTREDLKKLMTKLVFEILFKIDVSDPY